MQAVVLKLFASVSICMIIVTGNPVSTKSSSEELSSMFYSSIVYWDFDEFDYVPLPMKSQMKEEIMQELSHLTVDSEQCICPRNLGTKVCDNNGILHANICKFHCEFAKRAKDVQPKMILTETSFSASKQMCRQRFLSRDSVLQ